MSGGYFDYENDRAAREIFGWDCGCDYGMGDVTYKESVSAARKLNPLHDKMLSELAFDLFCLLHSFDWYRSGDIGEETYNEDVEFFKAKWLKTTPQELMQAEIDKSIDEVKETVEEVKETLYRQLLGKEVHDESHTEH